ncbi:MAG: caspase domain-containing protein [Burkholderiales bacterium]
MRPTSLRAALPTALAVLGLAAAFAAMPARAQAKAAEHRVALVVGNAAYPGAAALRNPVNDAKAVADRLRALGYEVQLRTDASQREMTRAVSQFGQSLRPGSVALFYYAGHGMQVRGRNFLVPVDAQIESEASARSESVDLDLVLEQLGPARLSMVILDACRNNPFENRFRSGRGGGLAQIDAPKGTLLAYATAPGKVASDGEGAHGLYTAELLKAMDLPGIKVEEAFKTVRVNVIKATASEQIPWESSSLTGDYYFRPVDRSAEAAKSAREVGAKQAELQARLDAERSQRERDAALLKSEMEKLREEVRRLSAAAPPAPAGAKAEPEPAAKPPPAKDVAATADPAAKKGAAKPAAERREKSPTKTAKASSAAPAPAAREEAPVRPLAAVVRSEWDRRMALLEAQRGSLAFPKAVALFLGPFSDEQLLVLVDKEKQFRAMPYHSAFAIAVPSRGKFVGRRALNERTPDFAQETALQRCRNDSGEACVVIVANGDFREKAFIEWAREAKGDHLIRMRNFFLGLRPLP